MKRDGNKNHMHQPVLGEVMLKIIMTTKSQASESRKILEKIKECTAQ